MKRAVESNARVYVQVTFARFKLVATKRAARLKKFG